ncbi:MAG: hypothetical protein LBP27_05315 [Treponema sp.]|jgi:hypothetical protein|nr:hypothetical protein [Treponema sp.]
MMAFSLSGCPGDSSGTGRGMVIVEGRITSPDDSVRVLAEGKAVSGGISLSKPSGTVTLTTDGNYSEYRWYVDSKSKPQGSESSLILKAADYSVKIHSVTLVVKSGDIWLSSEPLTFRVTAE